MRLLFVIFFAFLLVGCGAAQKDYSYMNTHEYKSRATLNKSLLGKDGQLSEESIQRLLKSRVKIGKNLNVAIVNISTNQQIWVLDKTIAQKVYDKDKWGNRVASIIPMPGVLFEQPANLRSLRQSAALMQADLLVVISPSAYSDWQFGWFEHDTAKSTTSLEVVVMDVRTSVIPYTALVTKTAEIRADGQEYSNNELQMKARQTSSTRALEQTVVMVRDFLASQ